MTREQPGCLQDRQDTRNMVTATLSCPQPDTTVCTVTGQVDLVTAPELTDTLITAVHDDRSHLVIDLSAADVLDSAGLQAVFEVLDTYDIAGHVAAVIDSSSEAGTTLDELLDRHDDLTAALQACASASTSTAGRHRLRVLD